MNEIELLRHFPFQGMILSTEYSQEALFMSREPNLPGLSFVSSSKPDVAKLDSCVASGFGSLYNGGAAGLQLSTLAKQEPIYEPSQAVFRGCH